VVSHRSAITTRTWVIDSGASDNYGINLRDFRKNSVKETNMFIKLGDDPQIQAKKKGSVHLGGVDIEAFFIPEFRISLLSVGQLDSQGYTMTFQSGICSIADAKGQKVLGAILEDGLYTLSTNGSAHISEIKMLRTASHSHSINMWHRRLAHLNHQDLRQLLESSGERATDPDIEPATDPMDVEPATDPMDVEPVTDLLGIEPPITVFLWRSQTNLAGKHHDCVRPAFIRNNNNMSYAPRHPGHQRRSSLYTQISVGL